MQISMFDGAKPLKINKPVRLIELFGGIGSQAKALERLGVDFEHYRLCEIDKYAVKSYNAIHGTDFTPSDITKITASDLGIVDTDKYQYIVTYSFPCQDLSLAGKQQGMAKGSGTRSGLLWEVERLLTEVFRGGGGLPQLLLMENVPEVVAVKNVEHFAEWIKFLDGLGYTSKWQILNAKSYGVPQNRARCFMVSWLGDYYYDFPAEKPLHKKLKDVLEEHPDKKYYLSLKGQEYIIARLGKYTQIVDNETEVAKSAITAKGNTNWTGNFVKDKEVSNTVRGGGEEALTDTRGILSPNLAGGIPIMEATKKGYKMAYSGDGIDISARVKYHRGTVQKGISQTITTSCNVGVID